MSIKLINSSRLLSLIRSLELQDVLHELSLQKNIRIWFVGGLIRDCILDKIQEPFDFDIIVEPAESTLTITTSLAEKLKAHYFILDSERNTYRITHPKFQMDINAIRGKELIDDLFLRDFSINSISISLEEVCKALQENYSLLPYQDYFGGVEDLSHKIIRAQNPNSFQDDPLRILRAFRFASQGLGCIEDSTFEAMIHEKSSLNRISTERIRDEFCYLLKNEDSFSTICEMEKSGILEIFFPFLPLFESIDQTYTSKLQVKQHSLSTLYYLEQILSRVKNNDFPFSKLLSEILSQKFSGQRSGFELLKIACLLHDIGKPFTLTQEEDRLRFFNHEIIGAAKACEWLEFMKFSTMETLFIRNLIECHMRPHNLSNAEKLTSRAKYRYFRESLHFGIPLLVLALADAYATRMIPMGELVEYESFVREMLVFYSIPAQINPCPYLNGHEIMDILGLSPSPRIGQMLEELLELQSLGQINSKEEAICYVKNKKL